MPIEIACAFDVKAQTGEGVFWDEATQALFFVDVPAGALYRSAIEPPEIKSWTFNEPLGCAALDVQGHAILALKSGLYRFNFTTREKTFLAPAETDRPENRFNDGVVDPKGRLWIGTMRDGKPYTPTGAIYRFGKNLEAQRFFDGLYVTNGLAFSPDGKKMYFSDTETSVQTIWVCDVDLDDGVPYNRRPFFETSGIAGRPDGATIDQDGCYWMAAIGGWQVVRLTPAGVVDRIVELPVERPSRPWFGGKNLDVLYVTSLSTGLTAGTETRQPQAGGLFAVANLGTTGFSQKRCAF